MAACRPHVWPGFARESGLTLTLCLETDGRTDLLEHASSMNMGEMRGRLGITVVAQFKLKASQLRSYWYSQHQNVSLVLLTIYQYP
ncbi:hypothetical protein JTE90_010903 [Oedothorax gibbosus]|uniref:Uncharacterized protein n=1 Tax=Oedothorax gibbosus TaxID=931172 RepID=A0AAV6UHN3_9ARAC|nr:hypothetical protein JTE90_010903 [Oedothorax gibbosus]